MQAAAQVKRIVCVGGGHCNCQVLKLLKNLLPGTGFEAKLTLVNEAPASYYSGMLPGTVSKLYTDDDLKVQMEPLAKWCKADYLQHKVEKIVANENKLYLDDGQEVEYDVLVLNVGSKTRGGKQTPGVWEHSLTTRPINDLIPKIHKKEEALLAAGIIPSVVICGSGAAGTELAFAFKARWDKVFNADINVRIVSHLDRVLPGADQCVVDQVNRKLKEHNIEVVHGGKVVEIKENAVLLEDGRQLDCTVPVWATGAEAQVVTTNSDLELMKGYFRVNDFLQSTSHPNVFAGGDCITMETYAAENFPPKAGVYAVRAGPFIAQNVANYIQGKDMLPYVPQRSFLSLLMTGDGKAIGTKFGIAFSGKWVWGMKDFIDVGFMNLFDPLYLFKDFKTLGTKEPLENNELFDDVNAENEKVIGPLRERVKTMDAKSAGELLACGEEETEFHERFLLIQRMNAEPSFADEVVKHFNPPYLNQTN